MKTRVIGTPPARQTAASYSISIRLNGITTPGTCHHCQAAVTIQHGTHPTELQFIRHFFECDSCGRVGFLYPVGGSCEHCNAASSEGGDVVVYHMPERQTTMTPEEIQQALYPQPTTARQLRMF